MARGKEFEFELSVTYTYTRSIKVQAVDYIAAEEEADIAAGEAMDQMAPPEQEGWELGQMCDSVGELDYDGE